MGIFKNRGGNIPGGNFPDGNSPGDVWLLGIFPGASFPDTVLTQICQQWALKYDWKSELSVNFIENRK